MDPVWDDYYTVEETKSGYDIGNDTSRKSFTPYSTIHHLIEHTEQYRKKCAETFVSHFSDDFIVEDKHRIITFFFDEGETPETRETNFREATERIITFITLYPWSIHPHTYRLFVNKKPKFWDRAVSLVLCNMFTPKVHPLQNVWKEQTKDFQPNVKLASCMVCGNEDFMKVVWQADGTCSQYCSHTHVSSQRHQDNLSEEENKQAWEARWPHIEEQEEQKLVSKMRSAYEDQKGVHTTQIRQGKIEYHVERFTPSYQRNPSCDMDEAQTLMTRLQSPFDYVPRDDPVKPPNYFL